MSEARIKDRFSLDFLRQSEIPSDAATSNSSSNDDAFLEAVVARIAPVIVDLIQKAGGKGLPIAAIVEVLKQAKLVENFSAAMKVLGALNRVGITAFDTSNPAEVRLVLKQQ